eukprot:403358922
MSVVAYSIGKAPRQNEMQKTTTFKSGPGSYEITMITKKQNPKWSMATRKISSMNTTMGPGPQSYEIPSKVIEHPGISIGIKPHSEMNQTVSLPGPGRYDPQNKPKKIAFTMGSRYKQKLRNLVPGPGDYEQKSYDFMQGIKFGTESRQSLDNLYKTMIPGPGEYSTNFQKLFRKGPKYGQTHSLITKFHFRFTTASREDSYKKLKLSIPGPGQYDQKNLIGREGISKTMAQKFSTEKLSQDSVNLPGPGQYEPIFNKTLKSVPSTSIGQSRREDIIQKQNSENQANPFSYNPSMSFTKASSTAWGFGSSSRPSFGEKKFSLPGPGDYQIPSRAVEGPQYVMGLKSQKDQSSSQQELPGPGYYLIEDSKPPKLKNEPKFSIGKSKRVDLANLKNKRNIPGPGQYQTIDDSSLKKHIPQFAFGTGSRDNSGERMNNTLAGPGSYQQIYFIGNGGRQVTISSGNIKRSDLNESRNVPGPGQYETVSTALLKNIPKFKIGLAKRSQQVSSEKIDFPNPHSYNVNDSLLKTHNSTIKFGTSKRISHENSLLKIPGPGQYEQPSVAFSTIKFAMGIKPKESQSMITPGPGQYEQNFNPKSKQMPAFTMAKRYKQKQPKTHTPGPGDYDSFQSSIKGPKFQFGSGSRSSQNNGGSPGPGQYKIPVKVATLPRYALEEHKEEFRFV